MKLFLLAILFTCGAPAAEFHDTPAKAMERTREVVSRQTVVFTAPPRCNPPLDSKGESGNIDNPMLGGGDIGVSIAGKPELQRLFLDKMDFFFLYSKSDKVCGYKGFGALDIAIPALTGASYRVEQKLYTAETISTFTGTNGTVTMKTVTPYGSPLVVVELATDKPVDVELKLNHITGDSRETRSAGVTDGVSWIAGGYTKEEADIPVMLTCAMAVRGANADKFTLLPGRPVTVVLSLRSTFDSPEHAAEEAIQFARTADLTQAQARHEAFWRDFWSKSYVEIGDPVIEKQYYLSYYILACCTGNPEFPPGLVGPWAQSAQAAWYGDYHYNYNFQAAFWHLYSGNHIAQTDGYDAPPLALMEHCRKLARQYLNCRGVYFPVGSGPKGITWCVDRGTWVFFDQKSDAAYILANTAMRWGMTRDLTYARTVYPLVLGVADFWEDYLKFENGRYVIYNDAIHENTTPSDFNPNLSLALVRGAMTLAIDMSRALGVDADRREKWQHIHDHMSQYPTQIINGKTVARYTEKGLAWYGGNTCGIQYVYPANGVGLDSAPEVFEPAKNTVEIMQRWFDENGSNSFFPCAAWVGYDPVALLAKLHEYSAKAWTNGRLGFGGGGLENESTVPNTINEMLLQSHEGVLRFFPVWPKDQPARFVDLRAYGAFLVSAAKRDNLPEAVRIVSEKGRPCTLVNPWPDQKAVLFRNGQKADTLSGARFSFGTTAGETIVIGLEGQTLAHLTEALLLPTSEPPVAFLGQVPIQSPAWLLGSITLQAGPQAQLFYTLDGSQPTRQSAQYHGPLILGKSPCVLRIVAVEPEHRESATTSYAFKASEQGTQLINTLDSAADMDRLKISHCLPEFPPRWIEKAGPGYNPLPGRSGILGVHPEAPSVPAEIERFVQIPAGANHPKLRIVTCADPNDGGGCYYVMQAGVSANGIDTEWFKEEKITAPADGWKIFDYDLSKYAGQSLILKIKAGSGGAWHNNRAYFDEVSVIENEAK